MKKVALPLVVLLVLAACDTNATANRQAGAIAAAVIVGALLVTQ